MEVSLIGNSRRLPGGKIIDNRPTKSEGLCLRIMLDFMPAKSQGLCLRLIDDFMPGLPIGSSNSEYKQAGSGIWLTWAWAARPGGGGGGGGGFFF
jgi:hypothetical protein